MSSFSDFHSFMSPRLLMILSNEPWSSLLSTSQVARPKGGPGMRTIVTAVQVRQGGAAVSRAHLFRYEDRYWNIDEAGTDQYRSLVLPASPYLCWGACLTLLHCLPQHAKLSVILSNRRWLPLLSNTNASRPRVEPDMRPIATASTIVWASTALSRR